MTKYKPSERVEVLVAGKWHPAKYDNFNNGNHLIYYPENDEESILFSDQEVRKIELPKSIDPSIMGPEEFLYLLSKSSEENRILQIENESLANELKAINQELADFKIEMNAVKHQLELQILDTIAYKRAYEALIQTVEKLEKMVNIK